MSASKIPSVLQRKINDINDTIDAGDFDLAARKLGSLDLSVDTIERQRKVFDYLNLKTFNRLQWLPEAMPVAARLAEYKNLDSNDYLEIALFYVLTARLQEAMRFFRRALAIDQHSALLLSELAILLEQQGKREKALAMYNKILANKLKRGKMDAVGARVLNRLAGLRALQQKEIDQITGMCANFSGEAMEIRLSFGLAKGYAKLHDTENEIRCLGKANRLADRLNESQPGAQTIETSRMRLRAIQSLFETPDPPWMPRCNTSDRAPIFILGMPRSGTTLLEQILGAHSSVGNSGESRAMGIAFKRRLVDKSILPEDKGSTLPFLRYKTLEDEDCKAIIDYYDQYQSLFSKKSIITDKEAANIDRVGIILKLLYPNARFICIRRHPLDVCASILQHDLSIAYFSASSIKIAQEYETYYEKAMHWKNLYPQSVSIIDYEALVSEFENTTSKLMGFLGLPWEEAITQFYKRGNSVRTPSLSQVRSPINSRAVGKWLQYRKLLEPAEHYLVAQGLIPVS